MFTLCLGGPSPDFNSVCGLRIVSNNDIPAADMPSVVVCSLAENICRD